jgi:hypothetical protein
MGADGIPRIVSHLITKTKLDTFKEAIIRWIVVTHITLSCVEIEEFRALIKLLNEGIFEAALRRCSLIFMHLFP